MTREPDFIGLVEDYLDDFEGFTPLPDATRDAIRARLPSTSQRPAWWPGWRLPHMNTTMKYAMGTAAVVVLAIAGFAVIGGTGNIGGPGETPPPTPTEAPAALVVGPLEAGTHMTHPSGPANMMDVTFTVPDGWRAFATDIILPMGEGSSEAPDGMALMFFDVTGLHSDPCWHGAPDVEVGTTVDELVTALAAQSAYEVSDPIDVTLDGYSGKHLTLQLPSDPDTAGCDYRQFIVMDPGPWAQGPGNRWHLSILDVEGKRLVIFTEDFEGTPEADRAELQAIVDSIRITP